MGTSICQGCGREFTPSAWRRTRKQGPQRFCKPGCAARHVAGRKPGFAIPWQERFWRFVEPSGPDDCWEWSGSRDHHGYGRINAGGRVLKAHRASYMLHNGSEIPTGIHVCHRCDNPPCVNPAHLFLGTMRDNLRDAARKGRTGPQTGKTDTRIFGDDVVRAVRERAAEGSPYRTIARDYGINESTVSTWATGAARLAAGGPITRRYPPRDGHAAQSSSAMAS